MNTKLPILKFQTSDLAGVAQWIECQPGDWKVAGSIPGQHICLGYGPGPQLRGVWEATDVSLTHECFSPFLPPLPSLKIKNFEK